MLKSIGTQQPTKKYLRGRALIKTLARIEGIRTLRDRAVMEAPDLDGLDKELLKILNACLAAERLIEAAEFNEGHR